MTYLNFIDLPEEFREGTLRLLRQKSFRTGDDGFPVTVFRGDVLSVQITGGSAVITYPAGYFFRALGILLEHFDENVFSITEYPKFQNLGVQLDLSRNGALRVDAIKKYMDCMALMGYNQLYLYMEDMFFVPGRDYFGYMRGRYTAAELKELDDYAFSYGIELIPSIQTLGHHEQYLRWEESADVKDTASELLVDCDATYEFIEKMICAVMAPLRTNKIVLGLDETHTLGLGEHLHRFGYEQKWSIYCRHMEKVFAITDTMGLESMIYSDMFFRMCAPDGWYYTEETVITPEIAQSIPQNATLVYWHYGETPGCDDYMLEKHQALNRKTVFFGGTWTWSGHLPNTDYAIQITEEALTACEKHGIVDVIQTLWGDDGNECNHYYALLTLQYTAEYAFGHNGDNRWLAQQFRACTGADADAFYEMSAYQCIFNQGIEYADFKERFLGKTLFWQDVLLGQYDEYLSHHPMSAHFGTYADRFQEYASQNPLWNQHYTFIETIFRYLSLKCSISEQLVSAYASGDRQTMTGIHSVKMPQLLELTARCHSMHKALWMESYKPFGWEVLDRRYGGTKARIQTATERINAYLKGQILRLEELEEPRLPAAASPFYPFSRIVTGTVRI